MWDCRWLEAKRGPARLRRAWTRGGEESARSRGRGGPTLQREHVGCVRRFGGSRAGRAHLPPYTSERLSQVGFDAGNIAERRIQDRFHAFSLLGRLHSRQHHWRPEDSARIAKPNVVCPIGRTCRSTRRLAFLRHASAATHRDGPGWRLRTQSDGYCFRCRSFLPPRRIASETSDTTVTWPFKPRARPSEEPGEGD